jgi:undecaprenyl diphosphate synthase
LLEAIRETKDHTGLTLVIALSYSARWEITEAVRRIAREARSGKLDPESITEQTITQQLCTANMPEPELLIRTSGEHRISNFLLWQIAYAELYFSDKLWPDFRKEDLYEAIVNYQQRERRFGLVSEQLNS